MRIIAGEYKGRIIKVPKGLEIRPTTDRVRESMFNSLNSIYGPLDNATVLDAYAGSGALGFEAVSRGAKKLFSFEWNKKNYQNLVNNFQIFKDSTADVKLYLSDVEKANFSYILKNCKLDILFFDPPYANLPSNVLAILVAAAKDNCIDPNAVIVYEHAAKDSFDAYEDLFAMENFILVKSKTYGDIAVEYLRFGV